MLYGCYRHHTEPEQLVKSLMDDLEFRIEIDMVRLTGPDFAALDQRLLTLWTVKHKLSNVAIFNAEKQCVHASEFLYKKPILISRGSYRPVTLVQQDMLHHGFEQFKTDMGKERDNACLLAEITLENLSAEGSLDEQDFQDRADVLCALGYTVIISSCRQHHQLIGYFYDYKVPTIGLLMGVKKLSRIIEETNSQATERLLEAFGRIFLHKVRFYLYPAKMENSKELMTLANMPVPEKIRTLIAFIKEHSQIVDIRYFNRNFLHIHHKVTLQYIREGNPQWEEEVPALVARIIREKHLFGIKE
jgi:hypothetical protein